MQVIREFVEAVNGQEWDRLMSYYAEDAVLEGPDVGVVRGKRAIRQFFERFSQFLPDGKLEPRTLFPCGDNLVVTAAVLKGTVARPRWEGMPGSVVGKAVQYDDINIFELRNGKILRQIAYADWETMKRQMGI